MVYRLRRTTDTNTTPVAVKAGFKRTLLGAFNTATQSGLLAFGPGNTPLGVRYVRVLLLEQKRAEGYRYTALIPVSRLAFDAKPSDPNQATRFLVERSGGFAGITEVAGPVTLTGEVTPQQPFFSQFLEGQRRSRGTITTLKAPSDVEDENRLRSPTTRKYPSDVEDVGRAPGSVTSLKLPRLTGTVTTLKAPSDQEDGGTATRSLKRLPRPSAPKR